MRFLLDLPDCGFSRAVAFALIASNRRAEELASVKKFEFIHIFRVAVRGYALKK